MDVKWPKRDFGESLNIPQTLKVPNLPKELLHFMSFVNFF